MTVHDTTTFNGDSTTLPKILHYKDVLELSSRVSTETQARNLYATAVNKGDDTLATQLLSIATPQGWNLTLPTAQTGKESLRARELLVNLMNLATSAAGRMTSAEMYNDIRFTQDALNVARTRYVAQATEDISTEADSILTQITVLADKAESKAATVIPTLNPEDAAQLTRTAQAWEFNILPQLGSNPNWNNILTGLGVDGLLAIQRFAPTWIKANSAPTTDIEEAISLVLDGVEDALPTVLTDPTANAIIANMNDANEYLNDARIIAPQLTNMKRSQDISVIGISVQNIAYSIGALGELIHPATPYVQM